jgi:hypothetical protein
LNLRASSVGTIWVSRMALTWLVHTERDEVDAWLREHDPTSLI